MTLRVRLALALSLLTAIAVTAMALVGYRATATRLYQEIDRSLNSSGTRFVDVRYAGQVCGRLKANAPDDGNRWTGRRSSWHRGPVPRPLRGPVCRVVLGAPADRPERRAARRPRDRLVDSHSGRRPDPDGRGAGWRRDPAEPRARRGATRPGQPARALRRHRSLDHHGGGTRRVVDRIAGRTARDPTDRRDRGDRRERPPRCRCTHGRVGRDRPPRAQLRDDARRPASVTGAAAAAGAGRRPRAAHAPRRASARTSRSSAATPTSSPATRDRVLGDIYTRAAGADRRHQRAGRARRGGGRRRADASVVDVDAAGPPRGREDRAAAPSHGPGRCRRPGP